MDLNTLILLFVLIMVFGLNLVALYWFGGMLIPLIKGGAPYVATPHDRVQRMIALGTITAKDIVIDLGSGDGRMVIAGAQAGARESIGYEVHPGLVRYSRRRIKKLKLENARIEQISLWDAPLGDVTVVLMYQIPYSMKKLEHKLRNELPKGARVVSHGFEFPTWKKERTDERVHLYIN